MKTHFNNELHNMSDGVIEPDSEFANEIGFTSDKFIGYLWKEKDTIIISAIVSLYPGQGNFRRLVENIKTNGFKVHIPNPVGKMSEIVRKCGYKSFTVIDEILGEVEIWEL